jgi:integrase
MSNIVEAEVIEENQLTKRKLEIKKIEMKEDEISYLSISELKSFLEVCSSSHKLAFLLVYETASRVSEALEVRFGSLDLDSSRIKLPNLKQRKQNSFRVIKISDRLKAMILQEQLERKATSDEYILKSRDRTTYNKAFIKYATKISLDRSRAHPHVLRHSRAIHLLDSGSNIVLVSKVLGHSSLKSTLIYLKYSNAEIDRALDEANKKL